MVNLKKLKLNLSQLKRVQQMNEKEEFKLKVLSWYHNSVKAWFISAILKDCIMAVFFLVSLVFHIISESTLGSLFSIFGIANIAIMFSANQKYIVETLNEKEPKSLMVFDIISWIIFLSTSCCLFL